MTNGFTRRRALIALGGAGLGAALGACSDDGEPASGTTTPTTGGGTRPDGLADQFDRAGSCTATPEQIEGPFWFDVDSMRRDIREDRLGTPLRVALRVLDASCAPVADAVVEVWHCDAAGLYSGFESASAAGGASSRTDEETYLRGAQLTDADGIVQFVTVYPGWYPGRTVHVHAKVHLDNATALTTQLYFDDAVTDGVYEAEPYVVKGGRDTRNEDDDFFAATNVLSLLREEGDGWLGLLNVTLA